MTVETAEPPARWRSSRSDWRVDENTGRPVLRHRLLDSDLDATVERVREAKKAKEVTKEDN